MAQTLTEGLLRRAAQLKVFHEWEESRQTDLFTSNERVAWYAAAFDFVKNLLGTAMTADKREKTDQVHYIQERLKLLKRTDRHA